ncbi:hypothetical protein B5F76_11620 [Desulfovibrio sp. An276]|nr:hypothetical protein B5F76_11620 [Desulfovibrio sp. An276]
MVHLTKQIVLGACYCPEGNHPAGFTDKHGNCAAMCLKMQATDTLPKCAVKPSASGQRYKAPASPLDQKTKSFAIDKGPQYG